MNTFFDKMRSGAGKAAFEADRLRRITGVQSELRGLREEMNRALELVGRVAFDLHQRGQTGPPELRAACDAAVAVLAQISGKETELEAIRNEQYEEAAALYYTPAALLCPAGHGPLPGGARFCQHCGAPGVAGAAAASQAACPTCGTVVEPGARFCATCGQPIGAPPAPRPDPPRSLDPNQPQTVPINSPSRTCPSCGTPVTSPGALSCAACGYPFQRAT